jgi:hypothetical protein
MLPDGYGETCAPDGSIAQLTLTNPGTGYTSVPTVTIAAPPSGGIQATATATIEQITTDQVTSVTVTNAGSGYTSAPAVTLGAPPLGGTQATATASVVPLGQPVQTINFGASGSRCYATAPTVSFAGGGGSGATATSTLAGSNSCVASWTVSGSCSSRKGDTVTGVGLTGATGSSFSGTLQFANGTGNIVPSGTSIQNPGTGYTTVPTTLGITGCPGLTFTAVRYPASR